MPNTKKLKPGPRKAAKRRSRTALKALKGSLTREERKAFRKEEKLSFKAFILKTRAAAEKAKAEAEAKAKEAAAKPAEGEGGE
jgi:hypothetical protein